MAQKFAHNSAHAVWSTHCTPLSYFPIMVKVLSQIIMKESLGQELNRVDDIHAGVCVCLGQKYFNFGVKKPFWP